MKIDQRIHWIPGILFLVVSGFVSATNLRSQHPQHHQHRLQQQQQPASVSCDAQYATPCARANSQWLATTVAQKLNEALKNNNGNFLHQFLQVAQAINDKEYNRERFFYPFVFSKTTSKAVAHGANPDAFVGKTLEDIYDLVGLGYANAEDLHERFSNANHTWVQYLWSNHLVGEKGELDFDDKRTLVRIKYAYIVPVSTEYYVGVGYEQEPFPEDLPCTDRFDSWCAISNVRSLVGKGQLELNLAADADIASSSSSNFFETTLHRISHDPDFKISNDFYLFVYNIGTGALAAHGVLPHESRGMTLGDILPQLGIGTEDEGERLHRRFSSAVENQESAWVEYKWRDSLNGYLYTKIAFLVKVSFGEESYYLGAGFRFEIDSFPTAPFGQACSQDYNLPCSFRTAYQLSSHALSHLVTSLDPIEDRFSKISWDFEFQHQDFYVFAYSYQNVCVAHGGNPMFVGMSLHEVFEYVGIDLDATRLFQQFVEAADQGNGWSVYMWKNPGATETFLKISYIFKITIDGEDYVGGIGFNHQRAPIEPFMERGTKKNGYPIACSIEYGMECSEANARAILGQVSAELILSSSEASSVERSVRKPIDQVLDSITHHSEELFSVGNFYASVFSFDNNPACSTNDGSGCAVANGSNPSYQGLTWNEILYKEGARSVRGTNLHQQLMDQSNNGGGVVEYPIGETFRRAWTTRFRHEGQSFYVVVEYDTTELPQTCDSCTEETQCAYDEQYICEPIPLIPFHRHIGFKILVASIGVGALVVWLSFRHQEKKNQHRLLAKQAMVDALAADMKQKAQGMFEIVEDMPVTSPEEYMTKVGTSDAERTRRQQGGRWYWKEDDTNIKNHIKEMVKDGTTFVAYSGEVCGQIEHAYQLYREEKGHRQLHVDLAGKITSTASGQKLCNPHTGTFYEIDFGEMVQYNSKSRFKRKVIREDVTLNPTSDEVYSTLPLLPEDMDFTSENRESLLPVFKGQIVQVSKVHQNGDFMFANVLYDPLLEDAVKQNGREEGENDDGGGEEEGLNIVLAKALHNRPTSGWFPTRLAKPADIRQMHKLLKNLGGDGSAILDTPIHWVESKDIRVEVQNGTHEYKEVSQYFLDAMYGRRDQTRVVKLYRIQNIPLWQSFAVKRQTMRAHYSGDGNGDGKPVKRFHNKGGTLDSLERAWLFHGTSMGVIPKIERRGFNRRFAGKNATMYGRGQYFARDALYSSHKTYAVPDDNEAGLQHIFMVRVLVGDWTKGKSDMIIPPCKPNNPMEVFDSTVDNVHNPSIFVTYADASSFPEYLVSFESNDDK